MTTQTKLILFFLVLGIIGVFIFKVIGLQLTFLIVIGFGVWFVFQYNQLQSLSQEVREAHSNIMVSMKKRADLANKLMEIAANYGDHEKITQLGVAKAESAQTAFSSPQNVTETISSVVMMARAYPELRANQTYQILMQQLEQIEEDLQRKREQYNTKVRIYNTDQTRIPMIFIASQLGFQPANYFDIENSDSLENLNNFQTDDGTQLKTFLSALGGQVATTSHTLASELHDAGQKLMAKQNSQNNQAQNTTSSSLLEMQMHGSTEQSDSAQSDRSSDRKIEDSFPTNNH
jgi:LemA protein